MSFEDFSKCFEKLEICHLGPEVMDEIEEMTGSSIPGITWTTSTAEGAWQVNRSAGGCRNFLSKKHFFVKIYFLIIKHCYFAQKLLVSILKFMFHW